MYIYYVYISNNNFSLIPHRLLTLAWESLRSIAVCAQLPRAEKKIVPRKAHLIYSYCNLCEFIDLHAVFR